MAAATQTAHTSPPTSKMSSPKDSKSSLPTVTKTEGMYDPVAAAVAAASVAATSAAAVGLLGASKVRVVSQGTA